VAVDGASAEEVNAALDVATTTDEVVDSASAAVVGSLTLTLVAVPADPPPVAEQPTLLESIATSSSQNVSTLPE